MVKWTQLEENAPTPADANWTDELVDSHRTSLHVMRRLVSTWPSPPQERSLASPLLATREASTSPPTGAAAHLAAAAS